MRAPVVDPEGCDQRHSQWHCVDSSTRLYRISLCILRDERRIGEATPPGSYSSKSINDQCPTFQTPASGGSVWKILNGENKRQGYTWRQTTRREAGRHTRDRDFWISHLRCFLCSEDPTRFRDACHMETVDARERGRWDRGRPQLCIPATHPCDRVRGSRRGTPVHSSWIVGLEQARQLMKPHGRGKPALLSTRRRV